MPRNGLVCNFQRVAVLDRGFFQEKGGDAFVETLPHDLLNQPHHVGKSGGHQFIGVVRYRCGFSHNALIDLYGNDPKVGVLFGFDGDVKLNGAHHAGCGKQTHIPIKQTVNGDLPSFIGEDIGAKLAGFYQQKSRAVVIAVVNHRSFFYRAGNQRAEDLSLVNRI